MAKDSLCLLPSPGYLTSPLASLNCGERSRTQYISDMLHMNLCPPEKKKKDPDKGPVCRVMISHNCTLVSLLENFLWSP